MYENYFGLKRRPFLCVPNTESFFPAETANNICQTAEQTIRRGSIPLLLGPAGTGKTLLLRLLRQSLEQDYSVSLIPNGHLETPRAFFQQLLYGLGLPLCNADETELRIQLIDHVLEIAAQQKPHGVVILIDNAQFLPTAVLESLRMLLDCGDGREPLFRTALAGTVELEEKLAHPDLAPFEQRVVARLYLENFSRDETAQYINRQLDKETKDNREPADWAAIDNLPERRLDAPHTKVDGALLFSPSALTLVYRLTDGLPRLVNQLCDTALELAAQRTVRQIDDVVIQSAWARLQQIEEPADAVSVLPLTAKQSEEDWNKIAEQKRETLQLKAFDSAVEFGTLNEEDAPETEPMADNVLIQFPAVKEYKPAYPLDEDENDVPLLVHQEKEYITEHSTVPLAVPRPALLLCRPAFKRHSPYRPVNFLPPLAMDNETLERYGAAVLGAHPPFVRREPHYVYQTSDFPPPEAAQPETIDYPDPSTGRMVVLNWRSAEQNSDSGFGTAYSRYEESRDEDSEESSVQFVAPVAQRKEDGEEKPQLPASLDESFEETVSVPKFAVSQFNAHQDGRLVSTPNESLLQHQLETVLRRLVRAAEKIERAADITEDAGFCIQQTADLVETEIRAAIPTYTDLFQELNEFHRSLSAEVEQLRTEAVQYHKPERRILQIDRVSKATIDARTLFQ